MVRLKAERLKRGWNQLRLAYRAKVAIPDISRFENRRAVPYPAQLQRLARVLEIDPARLLDEVDEAPAPPAAAS